MFPIAKELVDRFIEWLVKRSSGETLEEKLIFSLKTLSFLGGGLLWVIATLIVVNIHQFIRIHDTESAAVAVSRMFTTENNPIDEFIKINKALSERVESLRAENLLLLKDNIQLINENKILFSENEQLKEALIKQCHVTEKPKPKVKR